MALRAGAQLRHIESGIISTGTKGPPTFHYIGFRPVPEVLVTNAKGEEFLEKAKVVDVKSLEFHLYRGDFEKWLILIGMPNLAKKFENIRTLNPNWKDDVRIPDTTGRLQKQVVISEPAVYKLAFSSRKEECANFCDWVCEEVLPTIRRRGKYELEQKLETMKEKISNLQYLTSTPRNNNRTEFSITERLVSLNIVDEERVRKLLKKYPNGNFDMYIQDRHKYLTHIRKISMRMSKTKKKILNFIQP
jgi:prophage antirepressor-like protein